MGRWSASHWKTAIFGWLRVRRRRCSAIGIAVPMQTIDETDYNVGEARTGDHIIRDGGFEPDEQSEYVLVQSKTRTADDPEFRAVVSQAVATHGFPQVTKLRLLAHGGQRGADLGGRPLGADRVQPEGIPRRGGRVHR